MIANDLHNLLIRSLDQELSETEDAKLQAALATSSALRDEHNRLLRMRAALAQLPIAGSPAGLSDEILERMSHQSKWQHFSSRLGRLKTLWLVLGLLILAIGSLVLGHNELFRRHPDLLKQHLEHLLEDQQTSGDPVAVLVKMSNTYNQFNATFQPDQVADELTIVYIPGSNDPFSKIYDKHKEKKLIKGVQFIGGFREIMLGWDPKKKKDHLQEAFLFRYGKNHFPILLDLESEIADMLDIKGYSIIKISKKTNQILSKQGYDFDRIAFFKALQEFMTE